MSSFQLRVKLLRASHQLLGESFRVSEFCCFLHVCRSTGAHIYARNGQHRRIVRCRANESGSCNNHFNLVRTWIFFQDLSPNNQHFQRKKDKQTNVDWIGRHIFAYVIRDIFLILVLLCTNPSVNLTSHIYLPLLTLSFL